MPIFEYQCKACKAEFEKLVFANDDDNIACPECSSRDVSKKISAANVSGPGFRAASCAGGGARPVP